MYYETTITRSTVLISVPNLVISFRGKGSLCSLFKCMLYEWD